MPIPGTKRVSYLEENAAAADVGLTDDDLRALDEAAPEGATAGDRYPDMSGVPLTLGAPGDPAPPLPPRDPRPRGAGDVARRPR